MRTFIVNLDKDISKWEDVHARLVAAGIEHERFPAVYGKALPEPEKRAALDRFRWWCAIGRKCEDGELGCALSHLNLYRRMMDEAVEVACMLEDDVVFDERFPEQLHRVEEFLRTEAPRVVMLSSRKAIARKDWAIEPIQGDFGTFAYMLNLAAAKAVLTANFPVQRPADHWAWWRRHGKIELYRAIPVVCDYDKSFVSGTATKKAVKDYPLFKWACHKVKRVIGKTIDYAMG